MKKEINPNDTSRAAAMMWMQSPMPMVTIFKTFDVTRVVKVSKRNGMKFNMLLCWCIARAASQSPEFYLLPEEGKLMQYDRIAINVVVNTRDGGISTCDIPYTDDLHRFNEEYLRLTHQVSESGEMHDISNEYAVIGTSALVECEIDGAVNQYSGIFNNPFFAWGKYRKGVFRKRLPVSFQFHHTQMDGGYAARFLERLQKEITELKIC